ncbi:MAG: hypothetical protein A2845_05180 [Candidatus Lloydbacteria bacterium RIFCSPHIGHO2_01_FULL_49_22]|uniref:Hemerythrin-like domain-containing protein n=1 Tax=Candidatus Lloydbacteria bacterium RIFCSPHIGHO2_01_FULL_49_22 TaxID=1798658 RepID=A0A1G2CU30_9BACT|nr:MAG: hypothetical protein A2845_05180 [Candidatus Lloydbacteria bacterium RIFCSPHIGHO2_01_FULL_49_22]OGZ09521.1 MAG: hypothetical protein A3C14_01735 [Candidatus Lloydbacteria bacterium RIFCSPHIGHO2_02_FULL_50_18]
MDTSSEQKLVSALIAQHQELREDVAAILAHATSLDRSNVDLVYDELSKFKSDLFQHLKLENETFYVKYLAKKRSEGEDIEQLNNFIEQMDVIGEVVTQFLSKYATAESILNSPTGEFMKRLHEVTDILDVRIETEEGSTYQMFLSTPSSSDLPRMTEIPLASER